MGARIPPYYDSPPADFIESGEPVFVLLGSVITEDVRVKSSDCIILVSSDTVHVFDDVFRPIFEFFQTPRTQVQATEWLRWAGAPAGTLHDLVSEGHIIQVDTANPLTAAGSFVGIRIVPHSVPDFSTPISPGLVAIKLPGDKETSRSVTLELAEVLWDPANSRDISTAIHRLAAQRALAVSPTARLVLTDVPTLLSVGFARLERLDETPGS